MSRAIAEERSRSSGGVHRTGGASDIGAILGDPEHGTPRRRPGPAVCDIPAVTMALEAGEPAAGPWRGGPVVAFAASVLDAAGPADVRPLVVAVDGRSASGKTTLASRLQAAI